MQFLKRLLPVICLLLVFSNTHAQKLGIKAGVNLSDFGSQNIPRMYANYFTSLGYSLGISNETAFNDYLALETNLLFAKKGTKSNIGDFNYLISNTSGQYASETTEYNRVLRHNLYYIDLPIALKYYLPLRKVKLYANAGAVFSMLIKGQSKISSDTYQHDRKTEHTKKADITSMYKRLDVGLTTSIGMQFSNIQIGIQYNRGLMYLDNSFDRKVNRSLGLTVGYFLK